MAFRNPTRVSFALIAYASSWMKCHHPDVFLCAILNAQPMGFYAPAQLVRDAREHGVEVRPVDVNLSEWDCTLEPATDGRSAVRLGFCMVRGLGKEGGRTDRSGTEQSAPTHLSKTFGAAPPLPAATLHGIARADGYRSLGLSRREAAWSIKALRDEALPLFAAADDREAVLRPRPSSPRLH